MRIGILTSGGDCPGINATIRGVCKTAINHYGMEVIGIHSGFQGLLTKDVESFTDKSLSGLLNQGGTMLGTSREKPFKKNGVMSDVNKPALIEQNVKELGLDCVVCIGGNGTQKTAAKLAAMGLNIVSVPKTIDNDIWGTDMTFGFQSAVDIATECIDCIHTTAASHGRVFIVEVMGHKVGWLTLHAGIAGGADIVLIPEIPYDIDKVCEAIQRRNKAKKGFTILAVAEGAISKEDAALSKKEYKNKMANYQYPSVSYELADQIKEQIGADVRVTVPGHTQRGGSPVPYDRVLSTRIGAGAAEAILDEDYGIMIGVINGKIKRVPLAECAGKLKMVSPKDQIVKAAKQIGISFGD